jgi:hypothetical protein
VENRMVKPFARLLCKKRCSSALPSEDPRTVEPMFDTTKTSFTHQVTDAIDLAIDFATLGEYGLEPATRPTRSCEGRARTRQARSTGSWRSAIDHFAQQA